MDNQQCPFQPGQTVVCVDDSVPTGYVFAHNIASFLKKGKAYQINDVRKFPCGCWGIDIGAPLCTAPSGYSLCTNCNKKYWDSEQISWYRHSRFRPIQPLYEDITESLALEAMKGVKDNADQPIKQLQNN